MPNGGSNSGGGLYDQIKQYLPVVADAAIGGLLGGAPGAVAGAAGAGESEFKAQEFGQQQQDKMMQVMSLIESRKAREAEAQARLDEQKNRDQMVNDLGHQRNLIMQQNANTNEQYKGMSIQLQQANLEQKKLYEGQVIALRRVTEAMAGGKNIGDDDWDATLKAGGASWDWAKGVKSPKERELIASRLVAGKAAVTDAAMDAAWGEIAKRQFGGDKDAAMSDPMLSTYTGPELIRYAHRGYASDSDPAKFKKEMDSFTTDLEAAHDKWRTKDAWLKGSKVFNSSAEEAKGTLKYLKSASSMTPEEQAKALDTLTKGFAAGMPFGDIAKLIAPKVDAFPKMDASGAASAGSAAPDTRPPPGPPPTPGAVWGFRKSTKTWVWRDPKTGKYTDPSGGK